MNAKTKFTPTETRLLAVLADGMIHTDHELKRAIDHEHPELVTKEALGQRMHVLRKKLDGDSQKVATLGTAYQLQQSYERSNRRDLSE